MLIEFIEFIELIESVENAENVENDDDDGDGEKSMPVNVGRPNTNTPLVAGTVSAGTVGGAKTNAELLVDCTTGRVGRDISLPAIAGVVGTAESKADRGCTAPVNRSAPPLAALRLARARRRS